MGIKLLQGDCRDMLPTLPSESVHCVVTSPPYYGLRDYGTPGQLGLESTPAEYIASMVALFREVRRVLRNDGTLWLNIGDSYAGSGRGPTGWNGLGDQAERQGFTGNPLRFKTSTLGGGQATNLRQPGQSAYAPECKPKDLIGIPWMLAFALRDDGWYLRSDIIWSKPNPMPESVTDRPTKAHEYLFLLTKRARYFYDADAIREPQSDIALGRYAYKFHEPEQNNNGAAGYLSTKRGAGFAAVEPNPAGRNKRSVWEIATAPFSEAHFATFPPKLVEPCIKAGCPVGGTVLDPFAGAGTTLLVADRLGRDGLGIELNSSYATMAERRIYNDAPLFFGVPYEPVVRVVDKQGEGPRTYAGFNARWEAKELW